MLSSEAQRAEYDRTLAATGHPSAAAPPASQPGSSTPPSEPPAAPQAAAPGAAYTHERASRDQFVRKAAVERIRQALAHAGGEYDESQARGFDIALVPKARLFGSKRPRLLGRFIEPVDGAAVAQAWPLAVEWIPSIKDEVCVFLFGSSVASPRELAEAIAEQRRRNRTAKITIIPVDVRTWDAHIPVDSPAVCKDLIVRLKSGS